MKRAVVSVIAGLAVFATAIFASPVQAIPPDGWTDAALPADGFDMEVDEARNRVYVSMPIGGIAVIDMASGALLDEIFVDGQPHGIDMTPDGQHLIIALRGEGAIIASLNLDTSAIETFDVSESTESDFTFDVLAIDDARVLVTGNAKVGLIDLTTGEQVTVASDRDISEDPRLLRAGDRGALVTEGFGANSLYRLDTTDPLMPIVAEDDHGTVPGSFYAAASPSGDRVYLPHLAVNRSLDPAGSAPVQGFHVVTPDGSTLLTLGSAGISATDLATQSTARPVLTRCLPTSDDVSDAGFDFGYSNLPAISLATNATGDRLFSLFGGRVCADDLTVETATVTFVAKSPREDVGRNVDSGQITLVKIDTDSQAHGSVAVHQATPGVAGAAEAEDFFGDGFVWGDVDGNGTDDLIVSAPGEDIGRADGAGAITVLYDATDGDFTRSQVFHQGSPGMPGRNESGDAWGVGLDAGDINGDGYDDVLVGAPFETIGRAESAGAITVLYGGPSGLSTNGAQLIHQGTPGVPGRNEAQDLFGFEIAIAGSTAGSSMYVAVSSPAESVGAVPALGLITLFGTGPNGLVPQPNPLYPRARSATGRPDMRDLPAAAFDFFAFRMDGAPDGALAIGSPLADIGGENDGYVAVYSGFDSNPAIQILDFGRNAGAQIGFSLATEVIGGVPILAVGSPGESAEGITNAGSVYLYTNSSGPDWLLASVLTQNTPGVPGRAEPNDIFGNHVDLDSTGALFVGAPGEDIGQHIDAGAANVFFFANAFEPTAGGVVTLHQDSPGMPGTNEDSDFFGQAIADGTTDAAWAASRLTDLDRLIGD